MQLVWKPPSLPRTWQTSHGLLVTQIRSEARSGVFFLGGRDGMVTKLRLEDPGASEVTSLFHSGRGGVSKLEVTREELARVGSAFISKYI